MTDRPNVDAAGSDPERAELTKAKLCSVDCTPSMTVISKKRLIDLSWTSSFEKSFKKNASQRGFSGFRRDNRD